MVTETAALRRWLLDVALPLWWEVGADRTGGGFHEAINLDGSPAKQTHRARSIARAPRRVVDTAGGARIANREPRP